MSLWESENSSEAALTDIGKCDKKSSASPPGDVVVKYLPEHHCIRRTGEHLRQSAYFGEKYLTSHHVP